MEPVKFTPGPWEVEEERYGHDWAISAPEWGALALVVAEMDNDGSGKSFTKSEQGWANAHLIAAAPEMYAKLEKIAKWLEANAAAKEAWIKTCRFESINEDERANARNYRATAADIRKLIAKVQA